MRTEKPKGLYLLGESAFDRIYGEDTRRDIEAEVEIVAPLQTPESIAADPSALADVSLIFSGWGMARVDEAFLAAAPNLEAIFYAAGSVRYFVTDAMWERDVRLTSGYGANAEFVAPYTLAQIILSLKRVWHFANKLRKEETYNSFAKEPLPGLYTGVVGLISLGQVGRRVARLLQETLPVRVLAYDPFLTPETAAELDVEPVGLAELFRRCDVVSLHTPRLPETVGMITGAYLASMKANATFINTRPRRGRERTGDDRRAPTAPGSVRPAGCHPPGAAAGRLAPLQPAQRAPHPPHRRRAQHRVPAHGPHDGGGVDPLSGGRTHGI